MSTQTQPVIIPDPVHLEHETQLRLAHAEEQRRRSERTGKISALAITIVVHALAILVLTLIIIPALQVDAPQIQAKTITGPETIPTPVVQQTTAKSKPASASSSARLITSHSATSTVFLPSVNTTNDNPAIGIGTALGLGFGDSGLGSGGGGGLFGTPGATGGFMGTFYDFKRDASGKPNGVQAYGRELYGEILREFSRSTMQWKPGSRHSHFKSPTQLSAKAFFFPAIADTEAGKAFQAPETKAGMWVAHYSGRVTPSESGEFRFVGWGDNVMIVGIDGKIVFDACDLPYLKKPRDKSVGQVDFPRKGNTPVFTGEWFRTLKGSPFRIDVMLGDEGGIYCAGLHLQRKDQKLAFGKGGVPDLPLVLLSPLTEKEKGLYKDYLPDSAFKGPIFQVR